MGIGKRGGVGSATSVRLGTCVWVTPGAGNGSIVSGSVVVILGAVGVAGAVLSEVGAAGAGAGIGLHVVNVKIPRVG